MGISNIFDSSVTCKQVFDLEGFVNFYLQLVNKNLNYLDVHSINTSLISVAVADELNVPGFDLNLLKYGSLLHDIGKLMVPAEILNINRELTMSEFDIIKTHTISGYISLNNFSFMPKEFKMIALTHHYRNGFGYPKKITFGEEIDPLFANIISVADSLSAIMEPKKYKKDMTVDLAYSIISDKNNERNFGLDDKILDVLKFVIEHNKIELKKYF